MKKEKQRIRQDRLCETLLPVLTNEIFHVTSTKNTENIVNDNFIRSVHPEDSKPNYGTGESAFSRMKKWVAFFDIRELSDEIIEEVLSNYNFTNPTSLFKNRSKAPIRSFSIFCLKESSYHRIINNEIAYQENKLNNHSYKYIPKAEVWYPGDCPLSEIGRLIEVEFE